MNGNAPAKSNPVMPEPVQPKLETRTAPGIRDAAGDWLCAWCLNHVADDRDRFCFEGKSEFTFSNPEGVCFQIITFSQTLGCKQAGRPTLEHTWFPGHAWSFSHCDQCGQHLGWHYAGPQTFVGLITNRIVRAQLIRN